MESKKIIITGSATRIGASIAKSLAGHGIQITLHYNKSKKLDGANSQYHNCSGYSDKSTVDLWRGSPMGSCHARML